MSAVNRSHPDQQSAAFEVVRLGVADARRLAEFAERTFRETFAAFNTVEDMTLHCARSYGEAIQADELADSAWASFAVEREGTIVGLVQVLWHDSPMSAFESHVGDLHKQGRAEPMRDAEILRFYVDSRWHGGGIAAVLMRHALAEAAAGNARRVWLGVWERNPRAIAFYRKHGFVESGEHIFVVGTDPQRDVIMSRQLGSEQ